jgi:serine/threonine-protein kinase
MPRDYLNVIGDVYAEFGANTQDSGNISYGVLVGAERYFVKTAGIPDDPRPFLDHEARVALLRNAIRFHTRFTHPILPRLHRVIESPAGPMLVYPWLEGELLGVSRIKRDDPASPFQRFRSLPIPTIQRALDAVFALHTEIVCAGWVTQDFYDGCLLYDFASDRIRVVDLDMYQDAPFHNNMGRMFGSDRFMAPEEYARGALIDERTTVFVMGRTALIFLSDGTLDPAAFRGSRALFEVAAKACRPEREQRYEAMTAFYNAWQEAVQD